MQNINTQNTDKKININIYVSPEIFKVIESKRGLASRSAYTEDLLKQILQMRGELKQEGTV